MEESGKILMQNLNTTDPSLKDSIDDILQLSLLKEEAKQEIVEVLESVRGRKCLFVDPHLGNLMNQVLGESTKFFKDNAVQYYKELHGDISDFINEMNRDAPDNILYLVRPHLPNMKDIAQQIRAIMQIGTRCQFRIYFVPHQSTVCLHLLEEQISDADMWERITFKECRLGLIPLDSDLLSLEMDYAFKQCYVDGDLSCLNIVALALIKFQNMFGVIPNIKSKGVAAKKVLQRMMHRRFEEDDAVDGEALADRTHSEIDTLVILDREVDLISPLVTPLTYEGLVDDIVGIQNGKIRVEASLLGSDENNELAPSKSTAEVTKKVNPGEMVTLILNNNDSIFAEIRNLSIERIGSYMQEKAIHIRERYAAFKGNKDASLAEIHEFVKKIPKLTKDFKSLNQHIHVAEHLKKQTDSREFRERWQAERAMLEGEVYLDQVEELIYGDVKRQLLLPVMRLFCLQSLTSGGIRSNRYDSIRRLIIQTYGLPHLFTLINLEKSGLLRKKEAMLVVETTSVWQLLRKHFRLIDEKTNMLKPDDISYVAAGYAPLTGRLVEYIGINALSSSILEATKLLPGPFLAFNQLSQAEELSDALLRNNLDLNGNIIGSLAPSSTLASVVSITGDISSLTIGGAISGFRREVEEPRKLASIFFSEEAPSKKTMMVFIVGGVTLLEIAAFRYLSYEPNFPYRIIVASTKLINGSNFISDLGN